MTNPSKKTVIVEKAFDAFYSGGFHATGVDALADDAGVSKRTLYKYFPTKEHLIEAVLDHYGATVRTYLIDAAAERSDDPRAQIMALFDIRRDLMLQQQFRGCLAQQAAQEYRDRHVGIEQVGEATVHYFEAHFIALCRQAKLKEPAHLGKHLHLIFQGAVAASQMRRDVTAFTTAKSIVRSLVA
ncbi:TetR/AcrR family transcriptional regulator [Methylovirgula sp. 4M-Z18]|uniref:TetR/AcrR family transcriptional regulator n=1 Tax=Methylovirgula sp. 4M-Z18 TaxID=2293567 RepID=UPI000E2F1998|nr:TetR/AcrR family transcriptional regulator [Methylovirgula sp. 4M-Z18]RFB79051.1 TetR/AcrR family transcriptional regulator [Methylovirgula sp. 4M-Z18]